MDSLEDITYKWKPEAVLLSGSFYVGQSAVRALFSFTNSLVILQLQSDDCWIIGVEASWDSLTFARES